MLAWSDTKNECLNGIIWTKCPKNIFVSKKVVELAVASAVIEFNDSCCGILSVFGKLGMESGSKTEEFGMQKDKSRIEMMTKKSSSKIKAQRTKLRSIRKGYLDMEK